MGFLLKRGDKPKFVIPVLKEAIKLEPDQPGSHQQLASLLTATERASRGKARWQQR